MEQNQPAQDSIISAAGNQNLNTIEKPKRKFHIPAIAILIGFFIVLLVLMEGGLYFAKKSNNNSVPIPSPDPVSLASPTPDRTDDWEISDSLSKPSWKLYSSKNLRYSFEAPSTWKTNLSNADDITKNSPYLFSPDFVNNSEDKMPSGAYISISMTPTNSTNIETEYTKPHGGGEYTNLSHLNLDGVKAIKYESNWESHNVITNVIKNGYLFSIIISSASKPLTPYLTTYNQILTSFKFLDPNLSCIPRPSCLDSNPRCLIPETDDMCPPSSGSSSSFSPANPSQTEPVMVACTQDAKLCPDGKTYVSRQGSKCEFAKCPGE